MLERKMSDVIIIPNEMKMRGILDANEESVVIEGSFVGEINAKKVYIINGGKFEGLINSKEIEIDGLFNGILKTNNLVVKENGKVAGEIFTDGLSIDIGAFFSGQVGGNLN